MLRRFRRAQQAAGDDISLVRFPPGSCGFDHLNFSKALLQSRHEVFERLALKGFDNENAVRLQCLAAKIDRPEREIERARLIDVRDSRQIRRQIVKDHAGLPARHRADETLCSEIGLEHRYPWYWGDLHEINRNNAPGALHPLRGDLGPPSRRRTKIDHHRAGPEQLFPLVDLEELESGPRAVALLLRHANIGVRNMPPQPLLAGLRHSAAY